MLFSLLLVLKFKLKLDMIFSVDFRIIMGILDLLYLHIDLIYFSYFSLLRIELVFWLKLQWICQLLLVEWSLSQN